MAGSEAVLHEQRERPLHCLWDLRSCLQISRHVRCHTIEYIEPVEEYPESGSTSEADESGRGGLLWLAGESVVLVAG